MSNLQKVDESPNGINEFLTNLTGRCGITTDMEHSEKFYEIDRCRCI